MSADESQLHSILLRVRRVTTEYAYVSVPVTGAIMAPVNEQGWSLIDPDRLAAEAVRYAADPDVRWVVESSEVAPHPTQTPLPDGYPLKNQWASLRPPNETTEGE